MSWNVDGKRVLITGGNSGIGQATATELARRGARVTITARDETRGRQAVSEIEASAGAEVELGMLDLSSLDSVRRFAGWFTERHDRLDVLINNAGVMTGRRRETPDGFEWTFGVNHLGPFLLTNLLTELLVTHAPSRIINVSSDAHRSAAGGLDFHDLQLTGRYSPMRAYASSKLANILFAVELDRRLAGLGVTARALHPGVVGTSFGQDTESAAYMRYGMRLVKRFFKTPAEGAATSVFLATADDAAVTGSIYWSDQAPAQPIPAALDSGAAARLWQESERLVGPPG
jgi:NAD(P)-dependent dehydrogenase (short-subunit alcohol dehydrogenase family)